MASPCGPSPIEDRQLSVFSWCQMTNYGRESHSASSNHQPAFLHISAIISYIIASPSAPLPIEDRQLSVFSVWQITNYGRESHIPISNHQPAFLHVSVIVGYIIASPSAPSPMEDSCQSFCVLQITNYGERATVQLATTSLPFFTFVL